MNKKERIKEVNKRIREALDNNEEYLDLSNLYLSEKDNIIIPEYPDGKWYIIDLNNNNFKSIPEIIPPVNKILLENNRINYISEKILNRIGKDIDDIDIKENPIAKKYFSFRDIDTKNIIKEKNIDYIIIPKGTVLFRSLHNFEDIKSMYIGYNPENNKDIFILHPDHQNYFYLSPYNLNTKLYGNVRSLFILTQDTKVFLALNPSKINKKDMYKEFFENCQKMSIDLDKNPQTKYYCLKEEYKEKNIMGWLSVDFNLTKLNKNYRDEYYNIVSTDYKDSGIAELCLYSKKERTTNEIITKIEDFNETWLERNIHEFNFKPLILLDKDVSREKYKEIFDKLLSPEGFTNNDGTFHITVNKIDGTYVLAEEASKDTLKDCVSLSEDRVEYLKEYVASQK